MTTSALGQVVKGKQPSTHSAVRCDDKLRETRFLPKVAITVAMSMALTEVGRWTNNVVGGGDDKAVRAVLDLHFFRNQKNRKRWMIL